MLTRPFAWYYEKSASGIGQIQTPSFQPANSIVHSLDPHLKQTADQLAFDAFISLILDWGDTLFMATASVSHLRALGKRSWERDLHVKTVHPTHDRVNVWLCHLGGRNETHFFLGTKFVSLLATFHIAAFCDKTREIELTSVR